MDLDQNLMLGGFRNVLLVRFQVADRGSFLVKTDDHLGHDYDKKKKRMSSLSVLKELLYEE